MKTLSKALCAALLTVSPALAQAAEIRGDYVEARNADVYTGPASPTPRSSSTASRP